MVKYVVRRISAGTRSIKPVKKAVVLMIMCLSAERLSAARSTIRIWHLTRHTLNRIQRRLYGII